MKAKTLVKKHGDVISSTDWQDQSGYGRHPTAVNSPTYTIDADGFPGVTFAAASSQHFTLPNFLTGFPEGEIFIILKNVADPQLAGSESKTGIHRFGSHASDNDHYPYTDGVIYDGFGSNTRTGVYNPTTSLTSFHRYNVSARQAGPPTLGPDYWTIRINAESASNIFSNTVAWTTAPTLGKGIGSFYYDGIMREVLIFSRWLSHGERAYVDSYLKREHSMRW